MLFRNMIPCCRIFKRETFMTISSKWKNLVAVLAVFLLAQVLQAGDSPLKGANLRDHMSGPEMTESNAIGKVVFLEYWGLG